MKSLIKNNFCMKKASKPGLMFSAILRLYLFIVKVSQGTTKAEVFMKHAAPLESRSIKYLKRNRNNFLALKPIVT